MKLELTPKVIFWIFVAVVILAIVLALTLPVMKGGAGAGM